MVTFYSHIVKFIFALQLGFTKPQMNHLVTLIHGVILCEGRKTMTQIRRSTNEYRDLSCITRFLKESPWNADHLNHQRTRFITNQIRQLCSDQEEKAVTFLIIDDSQCQKEVSTRHMEGLDFHFSHTEGKSVWSHCVVTSHVVTEHFSFAWDFRPYFRERYCEDHGLSFKSKNDLAVELIQSYPASNDEQVYVLVDSWYTSRKLLDACLQKGFHVIGAFRSNRKLYPAGIGIKANQFAAEYIQSQDLHSVTVDDHTYKIYLYEGQLSDMNHVKVLLSWEDEFDADQTPFCILCTDDDLDLVTIQRYYAVRWKIETGYRYFKDLLGFDQYQLHSCKAIHRYWSIQFMVYNYLEWQRYVWSDRSTMTLGDVVRRIRKEHLGQLVVYVYEQALNEKPLAEVLDTLNIAA